MFAVTIIAVGKLKERFYLDAVAEYRKRLGGYCQLELVELPEQRLPDSPSQSQIEAALAREAEAVRRALPKSAWLCALTPEGTLLSSEQLAGKLAEVKQLRPGAAFLLGSSFGIDAGLKAQADFRLSMSKMTFPHHLARVMLLEQLYRAESIQAGGKYHK